MTGQELQELRAEILAHPQGAALAVTESMPADPAGPSKDALIAALISEGRTRTRLVPIDEVQAYLQTRGLWWSVAAIAAAPGPGEGNPAYAAAQAVIDVASARYQRIDMSLPIVDQMFGALVQAGVMTSEDLAALKALADVAAPVSAADVSRALRGPWG